MEKKFRVLGINHIGLAPKDANKARGFLTDLLSLKFLGSELVKDQKTNTHMFESSNYEIEADDRNSTETRLEVLENQDGQDGPIASFLNKRGGGVHHVALCVDNLEAALDYLKSKNIRLIDQKPRRGAHQTQIAFIHPESTGGLLIELVQE